MAADFELPAFANGNAGSVVQQALAIEAWARRQGTDTPVWFLSPLGGMILVHRDRNNKHSWLFSKMGLHELPIDERIAGIRMALAEGAQPVVPPTS